MAERRMFAKSIIDSDAFLDMPLSTQALYFHLSMRADDEGFVNNPKKIQRMIGASEDDAKLLILKRYILTFDSGVIVIKHWKIHNYIQNDRYKPTTYIEEKAQLTLDEKKSYVECIHNVSSVDTQVSIGKNSIDKCNTKLVNNIKNKNENIYSIAHEYMCKERTEEERESCRSRWSEFFRYCCTDKYINASNRVLDTILNARDLITEHGLLAFNSKNYKMEDFETILDKIDDDKFRNITQSVALEENIESNFYIIGSLIKAASEQK